MTQIKKILDKQGDEVFIRTSTKAVVDDNGYTAESRLQAMQDEINAAQLEIGAVPSDLTPTENSTNWVTSGGVYNSLSTINTALFGYFVAGTQENSVTSKFINSSGNISTSSTSTMTVAYYPLPSDLNVDYVYVDVPKTGSSSTRVVAYSKTTSTATSLVVLGGTGDSGRYTGSFNIPIIAKYIVVCYNSSGGTPVVNFHVNSHTFADELERDFSLTYYDSRCIYGGYLTSSGGVTGSTTFFYSPYLPLYGTQAIEVTCTFEGSSSVAVAFYDEDKTFISTISATVKTSYPYNIPSNAKYLRFTKKSGETTTLVLKSKNLVGFKSYLDYNIEGENNSSLKILHFGNSFTANTLANISSIINNIGVSGVTIQYSNHSGSSLEYWCGILDDGSSVPMTNAHGPALTGNAKMTTILSKNWDIIVFQQASVNSGTYSTYIPYLSKLISAARRYCPNKNVKIAFNMTWGTGSATYSNIVDAVETLKAKFGEQVDIIIGAGTALENIRNTSIAVSNFSRDGAHLASGVGEYVAGCAYYCALIQPYSGLSIFNDTATTVETSGGTGQVDVTSENRELCQKAAEYANIYKFGITDIENV